jgi:hypothetical protein
MVQMPALNTPQFDWVKSRLPRKPQPVPPIFQPEVAAEAIFWAAEHYRREWYVGGPTVLAIVGNKIAPSVGDWYLLRQGYDSQQYDGDVSPTRRDNLNEPVDEDRDFGAHGDFDRRAHERSVQADLDRYREPLALAGIIGGLCGLASSRNASWRRTLAGLSLGVLAAMATLRAMSPADQQSAKRKSSGAPFRNFMAEHGIIMHSQGAVS